MEPGPSIRFEYVLLGKSDLSIEPSLKLFRKDILQRHAKAFVAAAMNLPSR